MHEPAVIGLIGRRLVAMGCPERKLRSSLRELREHHEDLKQAAIKEGLSEAEAGARADRLLGEPYALAGRIVAVLRQSSWWGRHPIVAFCLLPLVGMLLMMALGVGADALGLRLLLNARDIDLMAEDASGMALFSLTALATWCGMLALTVMFFCWLACRVGRGLLWAMAACAACAFYSCCIGIQLQPHNVSLICGLPPAFSHPGWLPFNWLTLFMPLLVAARIWWRRRRKLKLFPLPGRTTADIRSHL